MFVNQHLPQHKFIVKTTWAIGVRIQVRNGNILSSFTVLAHALSFPCKNTANIVSRLTNKYTGITICKPNSSARYSDAPFSSDRKSRDICQVILLLNVPLDVVLLSLPCYIITPMPMMRS